MTKRQLDAIENYKESTEALLEAFGWRKINAHWVSDKRMAFVFPNDKVFTSTALEALDSVINLNDFINKW